MELIKPIQMNGFVVPYIASYLGGERFFDEDVLKDHVQGVINTFANQFMKPKEPTKPGTFYASGATKPVCQTFYRMMGTKPDPKDDPWLGVKFAFGDLSEALIMILLQLAYSHLDPQPKHSVGEWNSFIETPIGAKKRRGFIDALLNFNHTWHEKNHGVKLYKDGAKYLKKNKAGDLTEDLILEFKAVHSYMFELAQKDGLDDTWGWLGQMSCYQRSMKIHRGLFILLNRESGEMLEYLVPFDAKRAKLADYNATYVEDHVARNEVPPPPQGFEPTIAKYEKVLTLGNRLCKYCDFARSCAAQQGYRLHVWEKQVTFKKAVTFTAKVLELKALTGEKPPIRLASSQPAKKRIKDDIQTTFDDVMGRDGARK